MVPAGRRIGAMFSRVDGSMATAARSRRTNGRAVLAREGVAAVVGTRRCRKDEPKRSVGNTGNTGNTRNTGNPLPESSALDSSTISGASVYRPAAGLRRMGWRKWAETGGNSWSARPALRIEGMTGEAWRKDQNDHHDLAQPALQQVAGDPRASAPQGNRTHDPGVSQAAGEHGRSREADRPGGWRCEGSDARWRTGVQEARQEESRSWQSRHCQGDRRASHPVAATDRGVRQACRHRPAARSGVAASEIAS